MPWLTTTHLVIDDADHGRPSDPVLLLHGWPDDASGWDAVVPALVAAGLRVIVSALSDFVATRFVSDDAPRTGNRAILAIDAIALMDGLHRTLHGRRA